MSKLVKLRQFFQDEILKSTPPENFDDDFNLIENGILDSLAIMAISGYIEQEFGVLVGSDDIIPDNFNSVKAIAAYIDRKEDS